MCLSEDMMMYYYQWLCVWGGWWRQDFGAITQAVREYPYPCVVLVRLQKAIIF